MNAPRFLGLRAAAAASMVLLVLPGTSGAFSLFPELSSGTVAQTLSGAARWSSVTGLDDGIQVGIAPGTAAALQVAGDDLADVEQAIVDGILAWQSPVLAFDVTLDASGAVEGEDLGFEIDVFAVSGSHPVFLANPSAFTGLAIPAWSFFQDRPLTNGATTAGYGITGADVYLNADTFQLLAALGSQRLDVLTRVTIHELGHALGFGHPNQATNYDTNFDPLDAMVIDPQDPWAGLVVSPFFDQETIMSNEPCGPSPTAPCPGVFFTSLGNDERGGRDVLYPVPVSAPEPSSGALLGLTLGAALWRGGRRQRLRLRSSAASAAARRSPRC